MTKHRYNREPRAGSGFGTVSTREQSDIDAFFAQSAEPASHPRWQGGSRARRRTWSGPADEAGVDESRPALTADDAGWAAPADSADHGHLLPHVFAARYFTLTEGTLERLLACNRFQIPASPTPILFALRGCTFAGALSTPWSTSANLSEALPDHRTARCILGVWRRAEGQFKLFQGSTVPYWKLMELYRKREPDEKCNLLSTGLYQYEIGVHASGDRNEIVGALRQRGAVPVLRTLDDLVYRVTDTWDFASVGDNVHPSRTLDTSRFSSQGCLTVPGTYDRASGIHGGEWKKFRVAAGLTGKQTPPEEMGRRFTLFLLTGREARLAALGTTPDAALVRLRFGSAGPDVVSLQSSLQRLSFYTRGISGVMDLATTRAYVRWQQSLGSGRADAIVTPHDARAHGFDLLRGASIAPVPWSPRPTSPWRYRALTRSAASEDAAARTAPFALSGSVGSGGKNRPADVAALRSRLRELGYDWVSAGTGVDRDLTRAIQLFQSIIGGRNTRSGDGRVDVPGDTYRWLSAANAPRWQLMPLGSRDEGFINVERLDPKDQHDFGTDWLAQVIGGAAAHYRDHWLAAHPRAALLTVNDVSLPQGGDTPDHVGHETGLACDLRLPRRDGTAPGGTLHTSTSVYDRDATRAMIQAVRVQPLVSRVFFNDPVLIAEGIVAFASGHDNHIHFEIVPPSRAGSGASEAAFDAEDDGCRCDARIGTELQDELPEHVTVGPETLLELRGKVVIGDESATLITPDADVKLWVGATDGVTSASGTPKILIGASTGARQASVTIPSRGQDFTLFIPVKTPASGAATFAGFLHVRASWTPPSGKPITQTARLPIAVSSAAPAPFCVVVMHPSAAPEYLWTRIELTRGAGLTRSGRGSVTVQPRGPSSHRTHYRCTFDLANDGKAKVGSENDVVFGLPLKTPALVRVAPSAPLDLSNILGPPANNYLPRAELVTFSVGQRSATPVDVRPPITGITAKLLAGKRIVLDPGHGVNYEFASQGRVYEWFVAHRTLSAVARAWRALGGEAVFVPTARFQVDDLAIAVDLVGVSADPLASPDVVLHIDRSKTPHTFELEVKKAAVTRGSKTLPVLTLLVSAFGYDSAGPPSQMVVDLPVLFGALVTQATPAGFVAGTVTWNTSKRRYELEVTRTVAGKVERRSVALSLNVGARFALSVAAVERLARASIHRSYRKEMAPALMPILGDPSDRRRPGPALVDYAVRVLVHAEGRSLGPSARLDFMCAQATSATVHAFLTAHHNGNIRGQSSAIGVSALVPPGTVATSPRARAAKRFLKYVDPLNNGTHGGGVPRLEPATSLLVNRAPWGNYVYLETDFMDSAEPAAPGGLRYGLMVDDARFVQPLAEQVLSALIEAVLAPQSDAALDAAIVWQPAGSAMAAVTPRTCPAPAPSAP